MCRERKMCDRREDVLEEGGRGTEKGRCVREGERGCVQDEGEEEGGGGNGRRREGEEMCIERATPIFPLLELARNPGTVDCSSLSNVSLMLFPSP